MKRLGCEPLDDVEELFLSGLEESEFGVPEIVRAVRMWREFRERAHPTYRRPEVYAAAVEYVMVLFTDPLGKKMLVYAIIMQIFGALVIRKIVNIKV